VLRRIPADELGTVLERLVEAWIAEGDGAGFGEFCDARTDEELAQTAAGAPAPAAEEVEAGPIVRIPGVLLLLTDAADRIEPGRWRSRRSRTRPPPSTARSFPPP
jgi:hypothetical protein